MTRDRHPPTLSNLKQLKELVTMITSFSFLSVWVRAHMSERGASLVEYALLVALIAVVCIVAITNLGTAASERFSTVGASIDG